MLCNTFLHYAKIQCQKATYRDRLFCVTESIQYVHIRRTLWQVHKEFRWVSSVCLLSNACNEPFGSPLGLQEDNLGS